MASYRERFRYYPASTLDSSTITHCPDPAQMTMTASQHQATGNSNNEAMFPHQVKHENKEGASHNYSKESRKAIKEEYHGLLEQFRTVLARTTPVKSEQEAAVDRQRGIYEPYMSATLRGDTVSVFPDTGAAANFISLQYVRSRGLKFKLDLKRHAKTGTGALIKILGSVMLPFSFEGEAKSHRLEFNIMHNAIHDVVLGSPFLSLTETFTRHAYRIKERLRKACSPRICFLGAQQYVSGTVDGIYVDAVPDTGADVSVMSASFANQHNFTIDTTTEHQKLLAFADGSTVMTSGLIEDLDWKFGSSGITHQLEVYVLDDLETDLILDYTFLTEAEAFVVYEEDFWDIEDGTYDAFGDGWLLSVIKLVDKALKGSRWKQSASSSGQGVDDVDTLWKDEKHDKLNAYRLARQQAQGMTEDQRKVFLEPHLAQGKQFLESRPSRASASQSSISPVSSSPSTPVGAVVSSTPSGQSSFLDKLRKLKQKALASALSRPETS